MEVRVAGNVSYMTPFAHDTAAAGIMSRKRTVRKIYGKNKFEMKENEAVCQEARKA